MRFVVTIVALLIGGYADARVPESPEQLRPMVETPAQLTCKFRGFPVMKVKLLGSDGDVSIGNSAPVSIMGHGGFGYGLSGLVYSTEDEEMIFVFGASNGDHSYPHWVEASKYFDVLTVGRRTLRTKCKPV